MIITPSANGWSYDDSVGKWKLAYEDKTIMFYEQTDESIGTQSVLFVGTKDECEAEISRLGLVDVSAQENDNGLDIHVDA
jgi:hypothetical protein